MEFCAATDASCNVQVSNPLNYDMRGIYLCSIDSLPLKACMRLTWRLWGPWQSLTCSTTLGSDKCVVFQAPGARARSEWMLASRMRV